ncbi:expressed unknown protein [Seminavis robusta]|uniref:CRAL-TRIO domain-containing protein n=1 Tax=Seminavis robusta TaxID=568900 RepID=A0A9N8DXH7_9STRA|nr:expressed unknown protein [Seminavis robusta]|eukprot:Sro451_g145670.1 n/a (302) ;mRNA; r:18986-19891
MDWSSRSSSSIADAEGDMDQLFVNEDQEEDEEDCTMQLTRTEWERARAIKAAVEACDDVRNVPDFEYAKLAICCSASQKVEQIVEICYKLQAFRDLYSLKETMEDATTTLRSFFFHQPGLLMDVSYIPSEKCYTSSSDMAKMNFDRVQTDEEWRAFQGGCYYWIRSMESDFTAIRNGIIVLNECEGMSMMRNFNVVAQERAVHELWAYYPARHKESVWLNAPTAATLFYGILKRIINSELLRSWKLDGKLDGFDGRLDQLFHMPTMEIAQQALLQRMQRFLQKRNDNIQTFTLDKARLIVP